MKTIRLLEAELLNEAPTTARTDVRNRSGLEFLKAEWENPVTNKLDAAQNILNDVDIPSDVINKILNFGERFVTAWIDSMKLEEIYYPGNEFILLLKEYSKNDPEYLKNLDNFTKIYNVYAKNLLDTQYFKNKTYQKLINSFDAYTLDAKDFEGLFSTYQKLINEHYLDDSEINRIFFEKNRLRPLAQIRANLQGVGVNAENAGIKLGKEAAEKAKQFTDAYVNQMKDIFKDDTVLADFKSSVEQLFDLS